MQDGHSQRDAFEAALTLVKANHAWLDDAAARRLLAKMLTEEPPAEPRAA
jgi:hypothetical protein